MGPRPRPRNRTTWSDSKSRRLDTWRNLLRSRDTRRNRLNLTASASTPPEHHHLNLRSSELGNRQASNEPINVLHRTVFTPASSIDHRDLHRL
ncbi:hypothetical protein F2Q70_00014535 [Brassica cretica]|uniref:BnaC02g09290D protein n=2 Tax=Brassica TaxID=3705 RepID=A0A078HZV8_BRANA|nr:hypothetical protein F2Q70_00014535 [Brassica cretica]CDY42323.1 BnaC02g09290D [Brassica napus]